METGASVSDLSAHVERLRRLEALANVPVVRIRMSKDAFDLAEFRQAARELIEKR